MKLHGRSLPGQTLPPKVSLAPELRGQSVHLYALDQRDDLVAIDVDALQPHRSCQQPPMLTRSQARETVDREQGRLRNQRLSGKAGPRLGRVVPKDASVMPESYTMATGGDALSLGFIRGMARVGQLEDFRIEVLASAPKTIARQLREPNLRVLPTKIPSSTWTEDYGEHTVGGGTVVPARIQASLVDEAVFPDRVRRFYGRAQVPPKASRAKLAEQMRWRFPRAHFSVHGAVSQGNRQRLLISRACRLGEPVREANSHIEGGNMLTGTLPDGQGYALVGKDSVAVTRLLMEQELGRRVGQREALQTIAKDLGIAPEHCHAIEQPGEFHLDMRILCAAPGQVVVNDARAAYQVQSQWMRESYQAARTRMTPKKWRQRGKRLEKQLAKMRGVAQRRSRLEEKAVKDLRRAGLQVERMPAVFVDPRNPSRDIANFVNGRGGTNAQGERFFIGLGSSSKMERLAADYLMKKIPTGFSKIYFLDSRLTQQTLDMSGGIKCRTKPTGKVAPPRWLRHPWPSRVFSVSPN